MISEAKNGAHAAKFQTYKAGKLASKSQSLLGYKKRKLNLNLNYFQNSINSVRKIIKFYQIIAKS